jgi:hypothetical protein
MEQNKMAKTIQLRIYTINKGKMDEFVKLWRANVVPLRQKHGFTVEAGWIVEGENRFVWMMSLADGDWKSKDEAYHSSPERKALNPDPGSLVAHMELRFVVSVLE